MIRTVACLCVCALLTAGGAAGTFRDPTGVLTLENFDPNSRVEYWTGTAVEKQALHDFLAFRIPGQPKLLWHRIFEFSGSFYSDYDSKLFVVGPAESEYTMVTMIFYPTKDMTTLVDFLVYRDGKVKPSEHTSANSPDWASAFLYGDPGKLR